MLRDRSRRRCTKLCGIYNEVDDVSIAELTEGIVGADGLCMIMYARGVAFAACRPHAGDERRWIGAGRASQGFLYVTRCMQIQDAA